MWNKNKSILFVNYLYGIPNFGFNFSGFEAIVLHLVLQWYHTEYISRGILLFCTSSFVWECKYCPWKLCDIVSQIGLVYDIPKEQPLPNECAHCDLPMKSKAWNWLWQALRMGRCLCVCHCLACTSRNQQFPTCYRTKSRQSLYLRRRYSPGTAIFAGKSQGTASSQVATKNVQQSFLLHALPSSN